MVKLKWKKSDVHMCTPLKKRHVVKGYVHGQLAVHKLPDSKPTVWSITHVTTGMGVWAQLQPPFRTLAEVKEFARQLMSFDTWYIENSKFGDLSEIHPDRLTSLAKTMQTVLITNDYKKDVRKYSKAEYHNQRWVCGCGKLSDRYMISSTKEKWNHFCLECEPHDNERKEE